MTRGLQALDALPGFSRIRRPEMEDKPPVHGPGQGIQVLHLLRDRLQQGLAELLPVALLPFPLPLAGLQGRVLLQLLPETALGKMGPETTKNFPLRRADLLPGFPGHGAVFTHIQGAAMAKGRELIADPLLQIILQAALPDGLVHRPGGQPVPEGRPQQGFRHGAMGLFGTDPAGQIAFAQPRADLPVQLAGDAPGTFLQKRPDLAVPEAFPGLAALPQGTADPGHRAQKGQLHPVAGDKLLLDQGTQAAVFRLPFLRQLAGLDRLIYPVLLPGLVQRVPEGLAAQIFRFLSGLHDAGNDLDLLQRLPMNVRLPLLQQFPAVGFPATAFQIFH